MAERAGPPTSPRAHDDVLQTMTFYPSLGRCPTSRRGWLPAYRSSRCMCRWATSTPAIPRSTRSGGCWRTRGCRWSRTAVRGRRPALHRARAVFGEVLRRHPDADGGDRAPGDAGVRRVPRPGRPLRRGCTWTPRWRSPTSPRADRPFRPSCARGCSSWGADRAGSDFPNTPIPTPTRRSRCSAWSSATPGCGGAARQRRSGSLLRSSPIRVSRAPPLATEKA